MKSLPLTFKYIFLHFLQGYFSAHHRWTWDKNLKKTKIIVADQFSTEKGVSAKRPTVIIQRGSLNWGKVFRNEFQLPKGQFLEKPNVPSGTTSKFRNRSYTDLLQTGVTIRVLTKTGYEADAIANEIFMILTAYKDDLKALGVHHMTGLTMSGEQQVKMDEALTHSAVSITCSFVSQQTIGKAEKLYNARVYADEQEVYEGFAYKIIENGTALNFTTPPEDGTNMTIDYVDAVTLEEETNIALLKESDTLYRVPNGGAIYGYYDMMNQFNITNDENGVIEV